MIFEVHQNRPKMIKVRHLGGQSEKGAPILGGSAAEAVVLGRVLGRFGTDFGRTFDTPSATV